MKFSMAIAAAAIALTALPASAVQVFSTGYDMYNGATGSYNYWDAPYNGSGCSTCTAAFLSGGSGKLTDGIAATSPWYNYPVASDYAGTGQYVGWLANYTPNPTITFHFASGTLVTGLAIQLDDAQYGGVGQPGAIYIDGVNTAYTPLPFGSFGWVSFTGLNLTGNTHTVQLFNGSQPWIFASEVTFDGSVTAGVPEPASWALMIAGFGMVGGTLRSRRRTSVAA